MDSGTDKPTFDYEFPPDGPSDSLLDSAEQDFKERMHNWELNQLFDYKIKTETL